MIFIRECEEYEVEERTWDENGPWREIRIEENVAEGTLVTNYPIPN